ncbi:MAG: DUF2917 domain-containing protein [Betaproteobacteria bacterium]|nr:DUF2917 domain-containing protein [Betaproteobacteria bacterium]
MATRSDFRRLTLAPGDSINLDDARGTIVRVGRGRLWITQYGDPVDHVLAAGDTWAVERDGRTVVQAQSDTLVDLTGPGASRPLLAIARNRTLLRIAAWLRRAADARRWVPYA